MRKRWPFFSLLTLGSSAPTFRPIATRRGRAGSNPRGCLAQVRGLRIRHLVPAPARCDTHTDLDRRVREVTLHRCLRFCERLPARNRWRVALASSISYSVRHDAGCQAEGRQLARDLGRSEPRRRRSVTSEPCSATRSAPIVDESSVLKKGIRSCGVERWYSGIAGRVESDQIDVSPPTPPRGDTL